MDTALTVATILIALVGLGLGIRSYFRDKERDAEAAKVEAQRHEYQRQMTDESVSIQRQLVEIEEARHRRELGAVATAEAEREEAAQMDGAAGLIVRFAYRDSRHSWARIFATNHGPADATDVKLEVYGEMDGDRVEVNEIAGEEYGTADRLQPNESVHIATAFTMGSPQPADLRYRLTWFDDLGLQQISGRVPIG